MPRSALSLESEGRRRRAVRAIAACHWPSYFRRSCSSTNVSPIDARAVGSVEIPKTWPVHGTTAGVTCGHDADAAGGPLSS